MNKYNILHIGIHYNKNRGGGNLRNTRLLEGLKNSQFKLYIISYTEDQTLLHKKIKEDNFTIYYANSIIRQMLYAFQILLFKRIKVVHAHNIRVLSPIQLFFPFKKKILEIHSFHEQMGKKDEIFRYLLGKIYKVIVLANSTKRLLLEKYGTIIPENKIEVIINGIEKEKVRKSKPIDKNNICVGYIGSFYKWQGVQNFVEMVNIIVNEYKIINTFKFIMVGGGPDLNLVKEMIDRYQLLDFITLTGYVKPDLINAYWDNIDVIVMPRPSTQATETTIPLKLMDAICANKIVVASNVEGLTELLNNQIAILYDKTSNKELAKALIELSEQPDKISQIKLNLSIFSESMLTWETQNKKLQNIYRNA